MSEHVYKLYTSFLNILIQNHCEVNEIITSEAAGGKRSVWRYTEQLIKVFLSEVRRRKRNLSLFGKIIERLLIQSHMTGLLKHYK